ncbi:MAG: hypothetical protein M0Z50_17850 [Planctomycetia bacterium]|nr:hypothetical protein [Planctomycetia bacterium]
MKSPHQAEFGDFQTPVELAQELCVFLHFHGTDPKSIIEPTCGSGNILRAAIMRFPNLERVLGVDVKG